MVEEEEGASPLRHRASDLMAEGLSGLRPHEWVVRINPAGRPVRKSTALCHSQPSADSTSPSAHRGTGDSQGNEFVDNFTEELVL